MKISLRWKVVLGIVLVSLSAAIYFLHFVAFRDSHHIFIYLLGDIAFVPIEVLLVTLIIHNVLTMREKRSLINKMNMLIGAFYSSVGTQLIRYFSEFDQDIDVIRQQLKTDNGWDKKDFLKMIKFLRKYDYNVNSKNGNLVEMRDFLEENSGFLLNLLANPNLMEHESFTNLLWAVFHLKEELVSREDIGSLPDPDLKHLSGDIKRAYAAVAFQWLLYMRHLRKEYPYLFSLAMRTNPFNPEASPVVTE